MNRMQYFEDLEKGMESYNRERELHSKKTEEYAKDHSVEEVLQWVGSTVPKYEPRFSDGKLLEDYKRCLTTDNEEFVVYRGLNAREAAHLIEGMRRAGMRSFVFGFCDVNAFNTLDDFCAEGCKLDEPVQFKWMRHGEVMDTTGIRIIL